MSDDAEQRFVRAREVLREAGWVMDEFVNTEMRRILTSDPEDAAGREAAFTRARVATEMMASLTAIVDGHEYEAKRKRGAQ